MQRENKPREAVKLQRKLKKLSLKGFDKKERTNAFAKIGERRWDVKKSKRETRLNQLSF